MIYPSIKYVEFPSNISLLTAGIAKLFTWDKSMSVEWVILPRFYIVSRT